MDVLWVLTEVGSGLMQNLAMRAAWRVPAQVLGGLASAVHAMVAAVLDITPVSETLLETDITLFAMFKALWVVVSVRPRA